MSTGPSVIEKGKDRELVVMIVNRGARAFNIAAECSLWHEETGIGSANVEALNVPPGDPVMKSVPVDELATRATCRIVGVN